MTSCPDPGVLIVIDQLDELFTQTIDEPSDAPFSACSSASLRRPTRPFASSPRCVPTTSTSHWPTPASTTRSMGAPSPSGRCRPTSWRDAVSASGGCGRCSDRARRRRPDRRRSRAAARRPAARAAHAVGALQDEDDQHHHGADLDEVGGVSGAIGRRAEQIYQSFDDRCRAAAELVFLRLVSVTEEHGDTRRRVRRTELEQAGVAADDLDPCSPSTAAIGC